MRSLLGWVIILLISIGCAHQTDKEVVPKTPFLAPAEKIPAFESPSPDFASGDLLLWNAKVLTAAGQTYDPGYVWVSQGRIKEVGPNRPPKLPKRIKEISLAGKVITPGLIDTHSHLGVYASPGARAHSDGNEATGPTTGQVWAEHSFWPQDPGLWRAVSGGVTTIQVLPGSANLLGGRSFVAHLRPRVSARDMRFPGAKQGVKMACGENPKRVYGDKGRFPSTRMGNIAKMRETLIKAQSYQRQWKSYERQLKIWKEEQGIKTEKDYAKATKEAPKAPATDLEMETLKGVLDGQILVHTHCYRADDLSAFMDMASDFNFKVKSFHHGLEAYKIKERLAKEDVSVSTWADWWGFKMEAYDGIPQNIALLDKAGVKAIVHSDSADDIRRLNQEAQKAATAGVKKGLSFSENEILRWITYNPAWALGIENLTGTLESGKYADVTIWGGDPFSVYTKVEHVFILGHHVFDHEKPQRLSDFELGNSPYEEKKARP